MEVYCFDTGYGCDDEWSRGCRSDDLCYLELLYEYGAAKKSLWKRFKDMLKVARGQEIYQCGFSVREEDRAELKKLAVMANRKLTGLSQLDK